MDKVKTYNFVLAHAGLSSFMLADNYNSNRIKKISFEDMKGLYIETRDYVKLQEENEKLIEELTQLKRKKDVNKSSNKKPTGKNTGKSKGSTGSPIKEGTNKSINKGDTESHEPIEPTEEHAGTGAVEGVGARESST